MNRRRGQAMVEFAIVSMVLLTIVLGIMDFAFLFSGRLAAYAAARNAARYAATHPSSWSSGSPPAADSIEGHLVLLAVPAQLTNDDAHVTIAYYLPGAGSPTRCGQYSAATNAFVPAAGYTQATCLVAGTQIQVTAAYTYSFVTPFLKSAWTGLTITTTAGSMEES